MFHVEHHFVSTRPSVRRVELSGKGRDGASSDGPQGALEEKIEPQRAQRTQRTATD
jgi:hypothetical protein